MFLDGKGSCSFRSCCNATNHVKKDFTQPCVHTSEARRLLQNSFSNVKHK